MKAWGAGLLGLGLLGCGLMSKRTESTSSAAAIASEASAKVAAAAASAKLPATKEEILNQLKSRGGKDKSVILSKVFEAYASNEVKAAHDFEGHAILLIARLGHVDTDEGNVSASLDAGADFDDAPDLDLATNDIGKLQKQTAQLERHNRMLEVKRDVTAHLDMSDPMTANAVLHVEKKDIVLVACSEMHSVAGYVKSLELTKCLMAGTGSGTPFEEEPATSASARPSSGPPPKR